MFAECSFGHCGHTGTSIFIEPRTGLYVIILSDATISTVRKYGNENYDAVKKMREDIHNAIRKDLGAHPIHGFIFPNRLSGGFSCRVL